MNVVFLSPHFPSNYFHFCVNLRKLGANVLGIADEKYENLSQPLREALTEYYRVSDLHDYDQLVRAMGYFTHKYGKIDRFESHTEYWLATDARIRTDFNIPGIKNDTIDEIKHKSLMKQKFIEAGVEVAPGRVVRSLAEAEAFIREVGYSVVAKPDSGVGAAGTHKITTPAELTDLFGDGNSGEYFLEGFVQGKLYTFDGLVDSNGKPVFYTSHTYSAGIMETVNDDQDIYYYSLRKLPPNLEKAGLATLKAFGIRERFFHFEFFLTARKKVVGLEVNMRPPGGFTMDMFNFANDINLYYEWANIVMNGTTALDYQRKYHCAYIGRKFNKNYVHSHEEIIGKYGQYIVQHEAVSGVFSAALGNYGYLVRSPELSEVMEMVEFIHQKE
ncbi:ATP-grasp domain-containing protein [Sporomusa sphaeroides]|uniref:Argininosuccinate lyase n=1 Tax=Sporomusa sphaeroides DSM 2875 TaxID=1337886 RepID=A0ABP2CAU8_9FIRM|nr:ATP-grasp domain-containing protein [Sporomusa sphaeroides]OLS54671.1 argininosuccinate lyase [Sporomusa sphaeroides DSM 2875]CVK20941.1 argininosuccinate lyase [Sporomusa sphaeroides DSM 2875]